MKKAIFLLSLLTCFYLQLKAQYSTSNAHSHNDYEQKIPFYLAYNKHFGSIEADIWDVYGELFVAHTKKEITTARTLDSLYIIPIVKLFKENRGMAWPNYPGSFQLLIDLKTNYQPTLDLLVEKLKKYPEVFDQSKNPNAVCIVITGNRPTPGLFRNYPDFILFDGDLNQNYTEEQRKRIALFSHDFGRFSKWKGEGTVPEVEQKRLKQVIDSVHSLNCKIRFWNAPDNEKAWETLINMKADCINTDHIDDLSNYLKNQ